MKPFSTSQRLKQIMNERGLRQVDILKMSEKLQEDLGIKMSKSHLSQYVSGKYEPNQNYIYLLCRTLNVDPAWLMGYELQNAEGIPNFPRSDIEYLVADEKHGKYAYTERSTIAKTIEIMEQLQPQQQNNVYSFANKQLNEQNDFSFEIADEIIDIEMVDIPYMPQGAAAGIGNYHEDFEMDVVQIPATEIPYGTDFGILVDGESMAPTFPNGSIALVKATPNIRVGEVGIFKQGSDVWIKEAGRGMLISHNKDYPNITVDEYSEPFMVIGRALGYYVEDIKKPRRAKIG